MIHWLTINFIIPATPSNPSIPYYMSTSKLYSLEKACQVFGPLFVRSKHIETWNWCEDPQLKQEGSTVTMVKHNMKNQKSEAWSKKNNGKTIVKSWKNIFQNSGSRNISGTPFLEVLISVEKCQISQAPGSPIDLVAFSKCLVHGEL